MVAKRLDKVAHINSGYLLAKIHMVAKHHGFQWFCTTKLSSSKNPYGSKTDERGTLVLSRLSSSKNPYGSKTVKVIWVNSLLLSSSKNPYGSKTNCFPSSFSL